MSDDRTPVRPETGPLPIRPAAKRPWHTPKIEEVDYTATELDIGAVDASDALGYGSQP